MSFSEAIKSVFSKYATFQGRARRSEYWYFELFMIIVSLVISMATLFAPVASVVLNIIYLLAFFIPSLSVQTRRLHDVGKSGWLIVYTILFACVSVGLLFAGIGLENIQNPERMDESLMSLPLLMSGLGCYVALLGWGIYMLILMCKNSQIGSNKYGPNPKGEEEIATNDNF